MSERTWIYEGAFDIEPAERFLFLAYVDVQDGGSSFAVHCEFQQLEPPRDQKVISQSDVSFEITNPIDIAATALTAATAYATCLGWRMTRFSIGATRKCYLYSKKQIPGMSSKDRTKDVAGKLRAMGGDFKGEAGKALVDCIPFKDLFGKDGDEGEPEDSTPDI